VMLVGFQSIPLTQSQAAMQQIALTCGRDAAERVRRLPVGEVWAQLLCRAASGAAQCADRGVNLRGTRLF
jgi:hypothetical protein